MAILLAPLLMGISGMGAMGCGGGSGQEETPTGGGIVASSEHYSLDRASVGTSFGVIASPNLYYEANATIGYPLSDEVSASDSYGISHTINSYNVTQP